MVDFFNMGTLEHPEGLPHFTNKAMLRHVLERALKHQNITSYASLPHSSLRQVNIPSNVASPQGLRETMERVSERIDPLPGFVFIAFKETEHSGCTGGIVVENILEGMAGGRIAFEEPFGGFIPDIAIYPKGANKPKAVIEVVDTSTPSQKKLAFMHKSGVDVFILNGRSDPKQCFYQPVFVEAVDIGCRAYLRKRMEKMLQRIQALQHPFIAIKTFQNGTQQYGFGEDSQASSKEWHYGERQIKAMTLRTLTRFRNAGMIVPDTWNDVTRHDFITLVMHMATARIMAACFRAYDQGVLPRITYRESDLRFLSQAKDLLTSVRHPSKSP